MNKIEKIKLLLKKMNSNMNINSLERMTSTFFDEPPFHIYSASAYLSGKHVPSNLINSAGVSSNSPELALLKCVSELVERFSLYNLNAEPVIFSKYGDSARQINLNNYLSENQLYGVKFAWANANSLHDADEHHIPFQLIYFNNIRGHHEPLLCDRNSTGAAGGFNKSEVILRGIYEVIERDSFMTAYLGKVNCPSIDLHTIHNEKIRHICETYYRYNYEIKLIEITSDLQVPAYLTILIDKTKQLPYFTLGAKANLNPEVAIVGSLEEAFMSRGWLRNLSMKGKLRQFMSNTKNIKTHLQRAGYWTAENSLSKLNFFIKPKTKSYLVKGYSKLSPENELKLLSEKLYSSGINAYYVNITPRIFHSTNYVVYKVIAPQLQPLYLSEANKKIHYERVKSSIINSIPHPFL